MARSRGRAAAAVALLMAELVLLLGWPGAARAHTDLVASTPRAGETVPVGSDGVVLVFAEEVLPGSAQVVVRAPEGGDAVRGDAEIDGSTVRVPVDLGTVGRHAVSYRVTSADGHPVVGEYAFRVTTAGGAATDTLAVAAAAPEVDGPVAPPGGGAPLWAAAALGLLAALVVVRRAGRRTAASGDGEHLGT